MKKRKISENLLSIIYKDLSFRIDENMNISNFSIFYRNKFYYIRENKEESGEYILNIYDENNNYIDNIYIGLRKEYNI